jgi:hypothetical protein
MKDEIIRLHKDEVVTILNNLRISYDDKDYMLKLRDMIFSLLTLYDLFDEYLSKESLDSEQLKNAIKEFFKERWHIIHSSPLADNTEWCINTLCSDIAIYVYAEQEKQVRYPALKSQEDAYGNNFNILDMHQRILSDDGQSFIVIVDVLRQAIARLRNRDSKIFVYINSQNKSCCLSQNEIEKISVIYPKFSALIKLSKNVNMGELYQKLLNLRQGLLAGDVHHAGDELNAGDLANIAIAKFFDYYNSLSNEFRQELSSLTYHYSNNTTDTLGTILGGLQFPTGILALADCISIRGHHLETFLEENAVSLDENFDDFEDMLQNFEKIAQDIINDTQNLKPCEPHFTYQGYNNIASFTATVLGKWLMPANRNNLPEMHFKNIIKFLILQLDCARDRIKKYSDNSHSKKKEAVSEQHETLFYLVIASVKLARNFSCYKPKKQNAYLQEINTCLHVIVRKSLGSKKIENNYDVFAKKEKYFLSTLQLRWSKENARQYCHSVFGPSRVLVVDESFASPQFSNMNNIPPSFFAQRRGPSITSSNNNQGSNTCDDNNHARLQNGYFAL